LTPAVVVDTDVISFIFKGDTRSAYYLPLLTGKIGVADAWIAATASMLSLPLVTNNRSDFAGVAVLRIISHA